MASPQPSLWQRAIHFALGETVAQRCLQFAMLAPAAIWLRVRNMNAPWEGVLGKHIREGRKLDVDEKIKVQLWEAADICCVLLFVLVLLSPWWLRWANRKAVPQTPHKATAVSSSWRSRGWLCLWLVIAFAVRWNYMDRIILRDEQDTVRRNILGYVIVDQPGKEGPIVLDCTDTLWEDQQANNPFLFSVLSRITQRTWQAVSGAEPWRLNLTLLRLGALVPGLLSLAAIWWSLRRMGHPRASHLAVIIGAVHPMHVDYSMQARGYALVMMFTALAMGVAWRAMTDCRWRHWIALGGCFLGMLYSVPSSAYFVLSLGGSLAVWLAWHAFVLKDTDARCSFARLGISGAVAFLIFVPLVWPALPQAAGYLKDKMQGSIGGVWPVSAWSRYASGVMMPDPELGRQWLSIEPDESGDMMVRRSAMEFFKEHYLPEEPWLFALVFLVAPAVMLVGARRFFREHSSMWPVMAGGIAAPLLAYAVHHWVFYTFIYYWYLIYAMPVVLMLLAVGLATIGAWIAARWHKPWLFPLPTAVFLILLLAVGANGRGRLGWVVSPFTQPEQFDRGRFLWITQPDGLTLRKPDPSGQ